MYDPNNGTMDLYWDANGNLTKDADRQIDSIVYNILNLPDTIKFHNGTRIVNYYDAAGRKYRSATYTIPETQGTSHHEIAAYAYDSVQSGCDYSIANYSGNIETHHTKRGEEVTTSKTIHNAIGYWKDSAYYHFIKDHLGNVCAVVKSETDELVQSTIYYASGVPTPFSTDRGEQPYLYNGKELVEAPSVEYNVYDYGFRGYYAPIGRFTSVDPLAEQTPWQSPYVYANNNFANRIDYMGLFGTSPDDGFGSGSGSGMDGFQHDDDEFTIGGDGIGGYGDYEWGIWSWSIFGEHLGILGMQIRSYIIVDENGRVLDADPYACHYIVIGPKGEYLGGVQNDDWNIYLDPDGKWKTEDGINGLESVGWTPLPVSFYDSFIGKGNPAPGLYDGQWSISVSALLGICWDVDIVKKLVINLNATVDLGSVSYNGDYDFSELGNNMHNGMLGIGAKYMGYGGYILESFKVYRGSMEYVPASTTYSGGLLFPHTAGTGWNGNVTISAAISAVLGFSITVSGNIYYQGQ